MKDIMEQISNEMMEHVPHEMAEHVFRFKCIIKSRIKIEWSKNVNYSGNDDIYTTK